MQEDMETLGILQDIQSLVFDKLQVVSYKWLSRNYLVSSNDAKRLLEEFAQKNENGLKVVYCLSGRLKSSPPTYSIRLFLQAKLEDARKDFDGNCSIQVYSVQACIPKDRASLWNAEFVQAEELFKQPDSSDNCLRDNRFCMVTNCFVKRNTGGAAPSIETTQTKSPVIQGPSKSSTHKNITIPMSSRKVGLPSLNEVKDVKPEATAAKRCDDIIKPTVNVEKLPPVAANRKKAHKDQNAGGSIANLWGRASTKSKPTSAPVDNNTVPLNPQVSEDTCIFPQEELEDGSSEDDAQDANIKRVSPVARNRKRRVVLDYSDEDEFEDAVNLASPDPPKCQPCLESIQSTEVPVSATCASNKKTEKAKVKEEKSADNVSKHLVGEESSEKSINIKTSISGKTQRSMRINDSKEKEKAKVKEEKLADNVSKHLAGEESSEKSIKIKTSTSGKTQSSMQINDSKEKETRANSPKRRKVMKTVIDERGREVTEVVWEGEETGAKEAENNGALTVDNSTVTNPINRQPAVTKKIGNANTAQSNTGGKAGSRKTGANIKDPKQGNILSFFKKKA